MAILDVKAETLVVADHCHATFVWFDMHDVAPANERWPLPEMR